MMHGGLGVDHAMLHPWLDPLGDTLRLVYYDHRGNGRSGQPSEETMTHAQLVDDAEALITHLGFDQIVLVGHSYGGFLALEFAFRYPHRLSRLILLDTTPVFNYLEEVMENALRKGATEEMMEALQAESSSDEEYRQHLQTIWPLYFKVFDEDIHRSLLKNTIIRLSGNTREGELASYDVVPRLGEIQVPTLILVGLDDFVTPPSQAHILHKGIPNSELVIFENSGHFPFIEEADVFFETVREWIKRTS